VALCRERLSIREYLEGPSQNSLGLSADGSHGSVVMVIVVVVMAKHRLDAPHAQHVYA